MPPGPASYGRQHITGLEHALLVVVHSIDGRKRQPRKQGKAVGGAE